MSYRNILVSAVLVLVSTACFSAVPREEEKLIGSKFIPTDVDWAHPLYTTTFNNPEVLKDWKMEGGYKASISNSNLLLECVEESAPKETIGKHLVYWLDKEMPGDFLLEFTFRPFDRKRGLTIVFFNARGLNGESIFDPALAPRDGIFPKYHSGDINCYHTSYWAGDRGTANLRKNKGFHLVQEGKELVTDGPEGKFQTIRIYKNGAQIRVMVDDVVAISWDDDGKTYGPVITQSGWIGLRQMEHSRSCEYGSVKIYPIKK